MSRQVQQLAPETGEAAAASGASQAMRTASRRSRHGRRTGRLERRLCKGHLKNMCCLSFLALQGVYSCWKYCFSPGGFSKWKAMVLHLLRRWLVTVGWSNVHVWALLPPWRISCVSRYVHNNSKVQKGPCYKPEQDAFCLHDGSRRGS